MASRKNKILVVDDDPDITEVICYNLRKEKYEAVAAGNGIDALSIAHDLMPDLVLLDIRMPEMTGIEFCRRFRAVEAFKNIPVVFLTADHDEYTFLAAMEAGGTDYLNKPLLISILMEKVKYHTREDL